MNAARDYYERYWSEEGYQPRASLEPTLVETYRRYVAPTARALDVGCGDGRTSGLWLREHAAAYTGVDISERAVLDAGALGLDAQVIDDAATLPFPDDSFDVVVCIEVLEHLFSPFDTVVEIHRVLRADGLLIATAPNVAYWRRRLELAALGRWNPYGDDLSASKPWRDPHIRFFSPRTLTAMLQEAGFRIQRVRGRGGGFLRELPGLRLAARGRRTMVYAGLERIAPSLFGNRIEVVARV